jgi:hypothetical protein
VGSCAAIARNFVFEQGSRRIGALPPAAARAAD